MASNPLTAYAASVEAFSLFEQAFENVSIEAVLLDQDYDAGGVLTDVVDVTFRIIGRPGMFQVHPEYAINWQAQAFVLIGLKHAIVEGIYQGLSEPAIIPQPVTPGGTPVPPTPVPSPGVAVPV